MSTVVHGGVQAEELAALGLDPAAVVDLSANLHPAGPHPAVLEAARAADVARYPEPDAGALTCALAEHAGLKPVQVLVTPGATAALHLAARALLQPGDEALLFPPTFGEYEAAIRIAGARPLRCGAHYLDDPPRFVRTASPPRAGLTFVCNPNNPTGEYLARPEVEALLEAARGTLVLDVAYDPFVEERWDPDALVREGLPVVVVHSLTKLHAIPGLRVGYATGPAGLIARMRALQPAWAVGAPEQAAALAALAVDAEQRRAVVPAAQARAALAEGLCGAGLRVVEGRANFLLASGGDARFTAAHFRERLLRRGFAVRDCTSFGLPAWVRVAAPPLAQVEPLLGAVRAALEEMRA